MRSRGSYISSAQFAINIKEDQVTNIFRVNWMLNFIHGVNREYISYFIIFRDDNNKVKDQ